MIVGLVVLVVVITIWLVYQTGKENERQRNRLFDDSDPFVTLYQRKDHES